MKNTPPVALWWQYAAKY